MLLTGEVIESDEFFSKEAKKPMTSVTVLDDAGTAQGVIMMDHDHGFVRGRRVTLQTSNKKQSVFARMATKAEIETVGNVLDGYRGIQYSQEGQPLRAVA